MMRFAFAQQASDDLRALIDWYQEVAPHALERVLADINRSIDLLIGYPFAGEAAPDGTFRHLTTRKYGFKIAYVVEDGCVLLIGIFRHQNRER